MWPRTWAGDGVLVFDETGDIKQGTHTVGVGVGVGVGRQYTGVTGQVENCQVSVHAAYVSSRGQALVGAELYLPKSFALDAARCKEAGVPPERTGLVVTKGDLATVMFRRAVAAQMPFGYVAGDEVYGRSANLRRAVEEAGYGYVREVGCDFRIARMPGEKIRAGMSTDEIPRRSWELRSQGLGAKGLAVSRLGVRAVRLPTRRLTVTLDFPAKLEPAVWGTETTMTASALPFHTAIQQNREGDRVLFAWSTDDPPLHARYRLEWRFKAQPEERERPEATMTPSETMKSVGIIQDGDPILGRPARPFDLPREAEDARRVVAELNSAAGRVAAVHTFGKGMGIAAPQIGIDRSVAIVRTPDGETITLLNARIIEQSGDQDEQYEGCLSFFDVRCMVPRPRRIEIEHQDIDGTRRITAFEDGPARLAAHEVDHLHGVLCRERMRPGVEPIPVSEYHGTGHRWRY
jgi:peptide deformylase